jgi:copper chaperone CopZ
MENTQLDVRGMSCGKCVEHVRRALSGVDKVKNAEVNLEEGLAVVEHEPGLDTRSLIDAIEEEGYEASVRA